MAKLKLSPAPSNYDEVLMLMVIVAVSIGDAAEGEGVRLVRRPVRERSIPGLGFRGRQLGRFPQIDELGTAGQFEQLGVRLAEANICDLEVLCPEARVLAFTDQIHSELGRIPKLPFRQKRAIISNCAGIYDRGLPRADRLQIAYRPLAEILLS